HLRTLPYSGSELTLSWTANQLLLIRRRLQTVDCSSAEPITQLPDRPKSCRSIEMNLIQTAVCFLRNLVLRESGQDLVEYSLVFAMIALGSVTGMGSLASVI